MKTAPGCFKSTSELRPVDAGWADEVEALADAVGVDSLADLGWVDVVP